ncbi:fungal-specific transcription factor domain-containing protein [Durotheca rogersii]|uniref:fungal-specific transcription factor domain-containing protein n=1 Tax=Durotheca rogersii TaxID=419775 RepID=UPI00221FC977|nr:fungal-specific transcription factor domain-containing protein [Durotheca rogersii]KAI5868244.1 fungal-specific transcription factor domain-containing protein [Durotheca rogersii]
MKASGKRCGTCIDRKVRCDRGLPACSTCLRSNRVCQGYNLRLSWPRGNDKKRLILGPDPEKGRKSRPRSTRRARWVHATSWDVGVFYHLAGLDRDVSVAAFKLRLRPALSTTLLLGMTGGERDLLHFFEGAVSQILTTFSEQPLGSILMRIALSSDSPSCIAVRKSMLALSTLLRHGLSWQSERLKLCAIRALMASAEDGITLTNAAQHVAAGMLLCIFEIHTNSSASNQWLTCVAGATNAIANLTFDPFGQDPDLSALLDWAYYHEVLSEFSLRHWRPEAWSSERVLLRCSSLSTTHPVPCLRLQRRNDTLRLLSEACAIVQSPSDPRSKCSKYISRICDMQRRLEQGPTSNCPSDTRTPAAGSLAVSVGDTNSSAVTNRLCRIATLIYLIRASGIASDDACDVADHIGAGLSLLRSLPYCKQPFPLLIIGFEAKSDEDRMIILDLVARTEKNPAARSMECARTLLHAIWSQSDLIDEGEGVVEYLDMMTGVISLGGVLPPFA